MLKRKFISHIKCNKNCDGEKKKKKDEYNVEEVVGNCYLKHGTHA